MLKINENFIGLTILNYTRVLVAVQESEQVRNSIEISI